jgi:hypothetical protein
VKNTKKDRNNKILKEKYIKWLDPQLSEEYLIELVEFNNWGCKGRVLHSLNPFSPYNRDGNIEWLYNHHLNNYCTPVNPNEEKLLLFKQIK